MKKTWFANPVTMVRRVLWVAGAVVIPALAPSLARAAPVSSIICGELRAIGQFGPYDYRSIPGDAKYLVESAHFTPKVEGLASGNSSSIAGDLDYTLRAIPNHPRALLAMTRLVTRQKTERPAGARYPAECYFDRAIRMAPDDPMPHVIYASYLKGHQRMADAKQQLADAERLRGQPASFDFDYNLGLLYFEVGEPDKAAVAAKRAYALGAPFPALMKKLKAAGRWQE
ncbi:MAG: ABC transporter permease [Burkholderiaceae bacterium]